MGTVAIKAESTLKTLKSSTTFSSQIVVFAIAGKCVINCRNVFNKSSQNKSSGDVIYSLSLVVGYRVYKEEELSVSLYQATKIDLLITKRIYIPGG